MSNRKEQIAPLLVTISLITILGFAAKFYSGPLKDFVNNYLAGFFYEIFWCLVIFLFYKPRIAHLKIPLIVLIFTSILEAAQLWHPPFLEWIRSYFLGRAIIGTSFNYYDFLFYIMGVIAGGLAIRSFETPSSRKRN